jgi:GTPase-associated system helical domain
MEKYLSTWYRSAGIATEKIPLPKRAEAINAFEVARDDVASLTQLFFKLAPSDPSFEEKFRTAINEKDSNFGMTGDDNELVVLAGATLVDVIEQGERSLSDLAILCVVSASAQNLRGAATVVEIPELIVKHLGKRSAKRDVADDSSEVAALAKKLADLGEPYDTLGREFQKLQLLFPIVDEESNMLWWVFGETSRDLDKRWDDMSLEEVCLISPTELAALTKVLPGPVAARAFLDRAVRSGRDSLKDVSIADVVNKTPKDWRDEHYGKPIPNELKGILPLCEAVRFSIEAGDNDGWRQMFKSSLRVSAKSKLAPDRMAYQIFLERLTMRSFAVKQ